MPSNNMERLHTHDIEVGVSDVLQHHISRHVVALKPVSQRKLNFEHKRPRILRECVAEATGVFFYVFPGIAAIASFTVNTEAALPVSFFSNLLQVGFAFALGIAIAIITCAPVSGGHFNPAITICFAIWQGFPWKKVPHYILSQILGSFIAGLVLMGCYWPEIQALKAANLAAQGTAAFNGGAASILCSFPNPNQTNQGFLFFQEFMVDAFLGFVIWAVLDPANPFVSPVSSPFTIGLAYACMIWGFAANTISTNLARDLGTRFVAAIFFGKEAFTASNGYSWISVLVNIPATIFATAFYEFMIRDSLQQMGKGHAQHEGGEEGLMRHLTKTGTVEDYHQNRGIEPGYSTALTGEESLTNGSKRKDTV
ncbi:putative glycerol uptake [Venturia nashicola]|uniref:Putative glycerol uptake n=1 Tax=Venturia nashicola TaxID=86259 RepID=A0A4Z1PL68_9PEZI|nr:putative glycerol uptake [Venturia nashicola]TLD38677.1 putative glycerol uptake [Venturia nashicola]